ncbi:hypothetical protein Lal_00021061 [Lupinus albus]|nr:hypothetical protein Lal_00021061 [Lupinus albus]
MEEEMNMNHEIPEAVDEIDVSEDVNINEGEEFDFEEIDFGSLNEDEEKCDWYVSYFVDDHNHELVGEHYGGMIASNRSMTEIDVAQMNTMREVGIGTGKNFGSFAGQSGGYRYIGFSKKDMYNQIQRQRRIGNGDTESALQYLKEQSKSDSAMYWRHSVDEEGKLQQLFWADGCSIFDYSIFGDVLAFDATYGRNKYKFPVKVMYVDVEIDDFNMMWEEHIAKHGLHNNVWASQIFDCRSMWARSYIRGNFYAGLHTTSRCERLHSQMGRYIESGYNVTEFLHHFQRCVNYMRNNEVVEDFKSSYGDELLETPYHNLEGHAASIYIRVVFKEFREILFEAAKLRIISSQQTSSHVIYKIGKHYNPNKKWYVSHYDNGSNMDIKCSCKRMESFGMPCSHSVFVLLILDISQLPSCLVLERWIKKAKNIEGVNFQQCELSRESDKTSRYEALSDACRVLCNLACEKEEDFSEMLEKVYNECSRLRSKQHSSSMENVDNATIDQVRDSVRVRAKGRVPGITSRPKRGNQCGYQSWKSCLSERFSPERERITWESEILGYTGGFSPERELSRLSEKWQFGAVDTVRLSLERERQI